MSIAELSSVFGDEPSDPYAPPPVPHDREAEVAVLGACLRDTAAIADVWNAPPFLQASDFYDPKHELIFDAIVTAYARSEPVDVIATQARLQRTGQLARAGGPAYLHALVGSVLVTANAGHYADLVAEAAGRRRLVEAGTRIVQMGYANGVGDLRDLQTRAAAEVENVVRTVPGVDTPKPGEDIDTFLLGEDDPYDWLIPGVLERQDRLIVTAAEGKGKSTLLRQLSVQIAAGIHPFNLDTMQPARVLLLDLENSKRQSRRKLRPLRLQAGRRLDPGNLIIEIRTGGIDLNDSGDRAWLDSLVAAHSPDVLVTGPIYKMASGDPNKEDESKPIVYALDGLRERHDVAIILEAHTKKAEGSNPRHRSKEPVGWSGWLRWPEFGIHLSEDGDVTHWRGQRDERDFPEALTRGGVWPFMAAMKLDDQHWIAIRRAMREAGTTDLSVREIEAATGISKSSVARSLRDHAGELATLRHALEMEAS